MANISFAFEIGGETINPAELEDESQATIIESIVESVVDRIEDMVCPEHKEAPRFLCSGDSFDDLSVEAFGCCDKLLDEVKKRMELKV